MKLNEALDLMDELDESEERGSASYLNLAVTYKHNNPEGFYVISIAKEVTELEDDTFKEYHTLKLGFE